MTETEFRELNRKLWVNLDEKLPPQPTAISVGQRNGFPIPFGTYGNFSCITGPSKAGKSFFKQMLIARYLGGRSTEYSRDIAGVNSTGKMVLDFDTEQSPWQVQRNGRNIREMVQSGAALNYHTYAMRSLDSKKRLEFVEMVLKQHAELKTAKPIGLVAIDGIADLMHDTNSLIETNMVMDKIMAWTADFNFHLITVVHLNFGDNPKPTGHIGSAITKKAETVAFLSPNADDDGGFGTTVVSPRYTRNIPFRPIAFEIAEGIPTQCPVPEN